jgi:hypothetical protein
MFDYTISIGNIIQIGAFIGTIVWMFLTMRADLGILRHDIQNIERRQDSLNEAFTQLGSILTSVAVQDNRLHMVEKNIEELRHGQGFISNNFRMDNK